MKPVVNFSWDDLPLRLNNLLVRKQLPISKADQVKFDGFNERTIVSEIGKILENSGFEVFYECEAKISGKKGPIKCDLFAEPWCDANSIYVEVKLCWIEKDTRLYKVEFEKKILQDIKRLKGISTEESDRLFVLVAHSPEQNIEYRNGSESLSLKEAIKKIEGQIGTEGICRWSVTDLKDFTNIKLERFRYLHSFSCYF